jgi:hypothetical protein
VIAIRQSIPLPAVPITRSNRRGTDPYARWCGRGGAARCPPIPIAAHSTAAASDYRGPPREFGHMRAPLRADADPDMVLQPTLCRWAAIGSPDFTTHWVRRSRLPCAPMTSCSQARAEPSTSAQSTHGVATATNITGATVPESNPTEILSPVGAISPRHARLCRPRWLLRSATLAEKRGFSTVTGEFRRETRLSAGGK